MPVVQTNVLKSDFYIKQLKEKLWPTPMLQISFVEDHHSHSENFKAVLDLIDKFNKTCITIIEF